MSAKVTGEIHYESPIEHRLGEILIPMLGEHVEFETQREVCPGRTRRVDFYLRTETRVIAVECDGRDYHEWEKDRVRDDEILNKSEVMTIIRFRGCDIFCADQECANFVASVCPDFFITGASPLDVDGLSLLGKLMNRIKIKPIIRIKTPRIIVELFTRDPDGKFHGKAFTATRVVHESTTDPMAIFRGDL
jgi:hypothetical protein